MMVLIGRILVSAEILVTRFACNITECKGMCCCEGTGGAPLENNEPEILSTIFPAVSKYLSHSSLNAIEKNGLWVKNMLGGIETPLAENGWCVYATEKNGIVYCGIEIAWREGKIDFRKPVSCHLYPVRVRKFGIFEGLVYERWDICHCKSQDSSPLLFEFVSDALERKYGAEFVEKLRKISKKEFAKLSE